MSDTTNPLPVLPVVRGPALMRRPGACRWPVTEAFGYEATRMPIERLKRGRVRRWMIYDRERRLEAVRARLAA